MTPRPVPLCHRTIGQQKPRHDIEAPWLDPNAPQPARREVTE